MSLYEKVIHFKKWSSFFWPTLYKVRSVRDPYVLFKFGEIRPTFYLDVSGVVFYNVECQMLNVGRNLTNV